MITVENSQKHNNEEQRVHYIPCNVDKSGCGPANVKQFFEPYVKETDGALTASFRGYPLDGTVLALPESWRGVLLTETKRPLVEDKDRKFQVSGGFTKLVYWNYDKKPSANDNLARAMTWVDIAEAVRIFDYVICFINSLETKSHFPKVKEKLSKACTRFRCKRNL